VSVAGLTELNGGFRLDVFSTPLPASPERVRFFSAIQSQRSNKCRSSLALVIDLKTTHAFGLTMSPLSSSKPTQCSGQPTRMRLSTGEGL
jgi:hypothetical protein